MHKLDSRVITTKAISVEIALLDGSSFSGKISVPIQGRLSDVLNDDRSFVPVECPDGSFEAIAKQAIKRVSLPSPEPAAYLGNDPYLILGVHKYASPEVVKKAYRRLCALHHPDRIKSLDLGPEHETLATQNMARINNAYATIVKARTAAA